MSLDAALARISQIESLLSPRPAAPTGGTAVAPATDIAAPASFASTLQGAMSPDRLQSASFVSPAALAPGGGAGQAIVQIASSQVGQAEQPPGSNDGPAIAAYRSATAGAAPGEPWCAYFVSWAARQAGEPIGSQGQGLGYVGDIWSWAQQTGRAIPNGPGVVPQPGDLIVFGTEHVGIVKQVLPNGGIETVEGNYDNQVSQVIRSPTEATGYVRM